MHFLKNFITKVFTELNYTLLVAAGAETPAFAGEGEEVFVIAASAFYTGKAKVRVTAVKVLINYIENVGPPVTVHVLIAGFPDTLKPVVIIFDHLMVCTAVWRTRLIRVIAL